MLKENPTKLVMGMRKNQKKKDCDFYRRLYEAILQIMVLFLCGLLIIIYGSIIVRHIFL